MKIRLESIQDEINFNILEEIIKTPGLNCVDLGRKVYRSRYAVLNRTEYLEREQYITRMLGQKKTYLMYPAQTLTKEDIEVARATFGKNMMDSLKNDHSLTEVEKYTVILASITKTAKKSLRTLIALAKRGEATCQELTDIIIPKIGSQTVHNQLKHLVEKGLVTIQDKETRPFVYYLAPPLTEELLEECLEELEPSILCTVDVGVATHRVVETRHSSPQDGVTISDQVDSFIENEELVAMVESNQTLTLDISEIDGLTVEDFLMLFNIIKEQKKRIDALELRLEAVEQKQTNKHIALANMNQIRQEIKALSNGHH